MTVEEWQSVVDESLGLCAYCNDPSHLTMDHVMPLARGGAHDTENIAAACGPCNRSKGNTKLIVWMARRAASRTLALAA